MRILIGTPIHQIKDYAMEKWLKNVARVQKKTPADLLLVDNSPNLDYAKIVEGYCAKYGLNNYKVTHIDFEQGMSDTEREKRIEMAQETIRHEVLSNNYDAWFSWECDQIIPPNALAKLIGLIESGIMIVVHNSWMRQSPNDMNFDMGCTLVSRECLKKFGFLPEDGSDSWLGEDTIYAKRVLKRGGNYITVFGLIDPVYHLDNGDRF